MSDTKNKKESYLSYSILAPRFWHGMKMGTLARLVLPNLHKVQWHRWFVLFAVSWYSVVNSFFYLLQQLFFGSKIRKHEIKNPPVFIVGHWRSGTTFLHDLMATDKAITYPSTLQTMLPNQFMVTGWLVGRCGFLIPDKRPQDNVATGWQKPQEDEFAIMNMGACSPYLRIAFPNNGPIHDEFLDMKDIDPQELEKWKKTVVKFVKMVSLKGKGRTVVLKSPPHLGRIKILSELFPDAKFIHIARSPYSLFPSTMRLWKAMDHTQAFQRPTHEYLEEYVFGNLEKMYTAFESQRASIDSSNITDVRYEDLITEPSAQIERIYADLNLGDFEEVRESLETYLQTQKDYKVNKHAMDQDLEQRIKERWGNIFEKYGYE